MDSFEELFVNVFPFPRLLSICVVFGYLIFAVLLHKLVPGRRFEGPISPRGHIPVYKDNGLYCFLITIGCVLFLTIYLKTRGLTTSIVYDRWGEILCLLNFLAFTLCTFLYYKGTYMPSTIEHGTSGSFLLDYFWGTELYPIIWGIDVKVFTNCRFGMNVWAITAIVCTVKSYEVQDKFVLSSTISSILFLAYLTKFFIWESGYMRTIDIMLDRAGFYICWGCLVWVPGLYTVPSLYLAKNAPEISPAYGLFIFLFGLISICLNYDADRQKQNVRKFDGKCQVWGSPAKVIRASYKLESGETKENILLFSGWWGLARHFHYVPELCLALAWSLPSGSKQLMPYSYFMFLLILLVHRTFRDDAKCMRKYGESWIKYQQAVPYRMIPYIF